VLTTVLTPCVAYEGFAASRGTTLVHCDDRNHVSKLVAFTRYARTPDRLTVEAAVAAVSEASARALRGRTLS
jgi:hypothetical protein